MEFAPLPRSHHNLSQRFQDEHVYQIPRQEYFPDPIPEQAVIPGAAPDFHVVGKSAHPVTNPMSKGVEEGCVEHAQKFAGRY